MRKRQQRNNIGHPELKLGDYIRSAREESGVTLREFAMKLEVSPSYISKVERNFETPSPTLLDTIIELLKLDRMRVDVLMKHLDPELEKVIFSNYAEISGFLRSMKQLTPDEVRSVVSRFRQLTTDTEEASE